MLVNANSISVTISSVISAPFIVYVYRKIHVIFVMVHDD